MYNTITLLYRVAGYLNIPITVQEMFLVNWLLGHSVYRRIVKGKGKVVPVFNYLSTMQ
jgi:hypothetical protein